MATTVSSTVGDEWTADFFGSLNEVPAEPVAGIAQILEAMGTEPAFGRRVWESLATSVYAMGPASSKRAVEPVSRYPI